MADHRKPDPAEDYVRAALREAAEKHRPDREAIVDRVAVGRAQSHAEAPRRSRPLFSMRPVGAAAAVVSVVLGSMFAARLAAGAEERDLAVVKPPPAVTAPDTGPSTPAAPSGTAGTQRAQDPAATTPGGGPLPAGASGQPSHPPGAHQPQPPPPNSPPSGGTPASSPAGWLSASGEVDPNSGDTWSQNNVRIRATEPITSLKITIAVARNEDTAYAGRFTNTPNDDIIITVNPDGDQLVYSYVLRAGATLKAGQYLFAAQYTHDADHRATADSYAVEAAATGPGTRSAGTFNG